MADKREKKSKKSKKEKKEKEREEDTAPAQPVAEEGKKKDKSAKKKKRSLEEEEAVKNEEEPPKKKDKKDKKDKKEKKKKKEKDQEVEKTVWDEADLVGGAKRKSKFEKLMGAKKEHGEGVENGKADKKQDDGKMYFIGMEVTTDKAGLLMAKTERSYQIYLPAREQKLKETLKTAIDKKTAEEIEQNLLKQDEAARYAKSKSRGVGIGFQTKQLPSSPQKKVFDGAAPLEHQTFNSDDDEEEENPPKKQKKEKKEKKERQEKKEKKSKKEKKEKK